MKELFVIEQTCWMQTLVDLSAGCIEFLWRRVTVVNRWDLYVLTSFKWSFGGSTFYTKTVSGFLHVENKFRFKHPVLRTVKDVTEQSKKLCSLMIDTWSLLLILSHSLRTEGHLRLTSHISYWQSNCEVGVMNGSVGKCQISGKRKICRNPKIWIYCTILGLYKSILYIVTVVCFFYYCTVSFVCSFSELRSQTWPI